MLNNVIQSVNFEQIFENHPIAAVYLFGSQARAKAGPMSDYDFGILFKNSVSPSKYFDLKINLINEIGLKLKTNVLDVVILNEANCNIAMSVIKGKLIYETEREFRIIFELKIMREYKDREYYEKRYANRLKKQILAGQF